MRISGYTLLEILIVIIIVGIVAGVSLPLYTTHIERLKTKEGDQILFALLSAQHRYKLENGQYATNIADLDVEIPPSSGFNIGFLSAVEGRVAGIIKADNSYSLCISSKGELGCTGSSKYCANYPQSCI